MAVVLVYLVLIGIAALLYTLAMAQLLKDQVGCLQDYLDLRTSRREGNC